MEASKKEKIKACIAFIIITLIILVAGISIYKYSVEGEKNMPFSLSRIYIVSTAEGVENENSEEKWNFNIYQNNDVYLTIEKNEDYKNEEKIQSVQIDNIQVTKYPKKGNLKTYMPNSSEGRLFSYAEEYILEGNSLKYNGSTKTESKNLEIGNQGGTIVTRFSLSDLGVYISNDDEEIKHDGTMLKKINIENEDLKYSICFDLIINIKNKSYKTTINLDLPIGDITENGTESTEIIDNAQYVFKRI